MGNWIDVNQDAFNEPIESHVNLKVFVSPYDMPEAARGYFDSTSGLFNIEFKYMTEEAPSAVVQHNDKVSYYVGKDSSRILRIAFPVDPSQVNQVQCTVLAAMDDLSPSQQPWLRRGNYTAAKRAIKASGNRLFSELGSAAWR